MGNHAFVKKTKGMTPAGITQLLNDLNQSRFYGKLSITMEGENCWIIDLVEKGHEFVHLRCYIENKNFEMCHYHHGSLGWWVDNTIVNEVALKFDGTISDDAGPETWKGRRGFRKTFREHMEAEIKSYGKYGSKMMFRLGMRSVPKEFRG